jgi:TonB family protein
MKNYILLFAVVSSLAISQGCSTKDKMKEASAAENNETANATLVKNKKAEERAVKRAAIAKASAEKEKQRKLALLEKAKASPTYKDANGQIVYYKAEADPEYTGGLDELAKYLRDNLEYPADAREKGYEGTVFVDFVVDTQGRVREVIASDVVGEEVDISFKEESVRVVATMPGWKPGRQNGKAVDTSFSIPITFQLEN